MHPFRFIFALLTLVAWMISSNSCLLATTCAPEPELCCADGSPDREPSPEPCGASDCAKCVTLESGINLSVLTPLTVPLPPGSEDRLLSQLLGRLMQLAISHPAFPPPFFEPPPSRWCEFVPKALPVRGPSCIA